MVRDEAEARCVLTQESQHEDSEPKRFPADEAARGHRQDSLQTTRDKASGKRYEQPVTPSRLTIVFLAVILTMLAVGLFCQLGMVSLWAAAAFTLVKLVDSTITVFRDSRAFKAKTLTAEPPSPWETTTQRLEVAIGIAFLICLVVPGASTVAGGIGWFGMVVNVALVLVIANCVGGANMEFTRKRGIDFKHRRRRR